MHTIGKFITTARPDAIWRILADVEQWPNWTPTVQEITHDNLCVRLRIVSIAAFRNLAVLCHLFRSGFRLQMGRPI